ncbi:MAG TPA: hypothetical protein VHH11_05465 [Gammaproteobacteria bacterium]|nr:hypothetical protein [Gammaproteobacteria bacterium]
MAPLLLDNERGVGLPLAWVVAAVLIAVVLAAPQRGMGQVVPAKPFSLDDSRYLPRSAPASEPMTPRMIDAVGRTGGRRAESVYGPGCDARAVAAFFGPDLLPAEFVVVPGSSFLARPQSAADKAAAIAFELKLILNHLQGNGDAVAGRHHLCVGIYDFGEEINAMAQSEGYVMVDPRLITILTREGGGLLISTFEKFVYYHELAHALQYWNPALMFHDATARRSELVADCVAGALLASTDSSDFLRTFEQERFVRQAAAVGDWDVFSTDHHGIPAERANAVRTGAGIAATRAAQAGGSTRGITSEWLLQRCNEAER